MALQLTVSCSNHKKADGDYFGRVQEVWIDNINDNERDVVRKHLERNGWVVQFNGSHMDTYCSKKCAE